MADPVEPPIGEASVAARRIHTPAGSGPNRIEVPGRATIESATPIESACTIESPIDTDASGIAEVPASEVPAAKIAAAEVPASEVPASEVPAAEVSRAARHAPEPTACEPARHPTHAAAATKSTMSAAAAMRPCRSGRDRDHGGREAGPADAHHLLTRRPDTKDHRRGLRG